MTAETSRASGISIIYQENLLVPWMNVIENIFVGQEITKGGRVDFKAEEAKTLELCKQIGITLDLNCIIDKLSVAEQQFVKILKALVSNPKILIMDEPTSMFNTEDAARVLEIVRSIKASGVSIIYISHFLKEVKQIADRIQVIRDGSPVKVYDNYDKNVNLDEVVSDMVGRSASMFYEKEAHEIGDVLFEVKDLKVTPDGDPVSFFVRKGEILGISGMVGAGRTEIANAITGAAKKYGGHIYYDGKELKINSSLDSVKNRIAYITEDRQKLGLSLIASVAENMTTVGLQTDKIPSNFVSVKKLVPMIKEVSEGLKIKMTTPMQEVRSLSGGNQQKVVLGKWLFTDCNVYIFDEPTRGIDVNAKAEFYKLMTNICKEGKCIIMISSDMPEMISMSDRVAVVRDGKITRILEKEDISEDSIVRYALGVEEK